jgi:four helix bundle protein
VERDLVLINERPHKKLLVWSRSIDFVALIYEETKQFPRDEEYGLKSQLRRAAVSVPSNIAEGLTRKTQNDKLHFLNIAQASLSEIDTQIEISLRLNYIDNARCQRIESDMIEIQKLLAGLSIKLKNVK